MPTAPGPATLAIVVPTYNERANVGVIVEGVRGALDGHAWELLFVDDDSPDGTLAEVERHAAADGRIRRVRRIGRRGLASACIEGALASTAPFVAVMDGDAQHDPALLPRMLELARAGHDVVIGAREDAGAEDFRSPWRRALTRAGNALGSYLARGQTRDPLSGFFIARREVIDARVPKMYGHGFKVLLDLLSASPGPLRVAEVPMRLRPRAAGASKLGAATVVNYALLLAYRLGGGLVSPRFALYCAVGLTGVGVNLAVLQVLYGAFGGLFAPAQAVATYVAMTTNFFLNNLLTFRDRRLHGAAMGHGLLRFYAACTLGAIVGVGVGELVHQLGHAVWLAGIAAAVVSAVWNFTLNAELTWRAR